MIDHDEALKILADHTVDWGEETIYLSQSLGRVLARDIQSDMDMPPFPKSAMDGYACRQEDLDKKLILIETIPAGHTAQHEITEGTCSKIMTGAAVPSGADCVFMKEDAIINSDDTISCTNQQTKSNICVRGEDVKTDEAVLFSGQTISPQYLPILASVGCTKVPVKAKPSVGVVATGSELVEPNEKPTGSKIRNSNSSQLLGQLAQLNISAKYYGICPDNSDETKQFITKTIEENDIIFLTGGVSVGDFDLIPNILSKLGFEMLVSDIAIQPGKPVKVAKKENKFIFALSGNPVSSFIQFELLAKYFINVSFSKTYSPTRIMYKLGFDYSRKKAKRHAFVPIKIHEDGTISSVNFNGSAHIQSFAFANGVMEIPKGTLSLKTGEFVYVRPL